MKASNKKRILFLNSCVSGGGAGRSLLTILQEADARFSAHVVMPNMGVMGKHFQDVATLWFEPSFIERVQKSHFPLGNQLPFSWMRTVAGIASMVFSSYRIANVIKVLQPDVLYCNHMLAEPIGVLLANIFKLPCIIHARNTHATPIGRWFYKFLARNKQVKKVISNSECTAAIYQDVVPEKTQVIHNSINLEHFDIAKARQQRRLTVSKKPEEFLVAFLGRIVPWKGLHILLDAISALPKNINNIKLLVLSSPDSSAPKSYQDKISRKIRLLEQSGRILHVGFQADVRSLLSQVDLLIVPSITPEPFGRVLLEAMALKTAILVSKHGGAIEVTQGDTFAYTFTPSNVDSLQKSLLHAMNQNVERKALTEKAYAHVKAHFSQTVISPKIYDCIYSTLVQERRHMMAA